MKMSKEDFFKMLTKNKSLSVEPTVEANKAMKVLKMVDEKLRKVSAFDKPVSHLDKVKPVPEHQIPLKQPINDPDAKERWFNREMAKIDSALERKFFGIWVDLNGNPLFHEYRFHLKRRWRIDFYEPMSKTAIEIQGQTWIKGGHSSGRGIERDCVKANEMTFMRINHFKLTAQMITSENIQRIIDFCIGRAGASKDRP